jgi:thioester reductase-like protein
MKNYFTFNFVEKTIVGSKAAIARANKGMMPEYNELTDKLNAHPDFKVVQKVIDQKATKKTYNNLSFDRMKEYIETQPNSEQKIKEFEAVKTVAASKNAKYPLTKKWFLKTYPEYKENNISEEEAANLLAQAAAALEGITLTEEELKETDETEINKVA